MYFRFEKKLPPKEFIDFCFRWSDQVDLERFDSFRSWDYLTEFLSNQRLINEFQISYHILFSIFITRLR